MENEKLTNKEDAKESLEEDRLKESVDNLLEDEDTSINKEDILLSVLQEIKNNLDVAMSLLGEGHYRSKSLKITSEKKDGAKIIEGVFAGDCMIGSDGVRYDIPANYASKSRLVEGDIMKLTVTNSGNFIYKQIKPIERKRMTGELVVDSERDEYWVVALNNKWKVLKASATYFKGYSGDQVAFVIPQDGPAKWAAVENIVKVDKMEDEL